MNDEGRPSDRRQVLVRRGVIAVLALLGLLILTAYFRETQDGPLHEAQTDAGALVAPIQDAVSRAVEPVRDAWSWSAGLVDARQDAKRLEAENNALRKQVVDARAALEDLEDRARIEAAAEDSPEGYDPIIARVTGRSITNWFSRARLNVGSDDGVVRQSPVIALGTAGSGALVGHVITVTPRSSVVTFITDPRTRVGGRVLNSGGARGLIQATASGDLLMTNVPKDFRVNDDDIVITGGFGSGRFPSVYPPNLPVGQVERVGGPEGDTYPPIQVRSLVDPRILDRMIVLRPVSDEALRRAAG